eukprot:m.149132 g.149132  ORF g.149132 m.149132 type:complete len:190 (-) comp17805_c0_seq1:779-1348(-)
MSTLWKDVIAFCEKAIENTSLDQDELREKISNAIQDVRDSNTLQVLFAHRWDEQLDEFTREPDLDELEELKAELGKVAPLKRKNIGIKFCPECNNMLYPAQHMTPDGGRLQYECKVKDCGYSEFATDTCIYINRMTQDIEYEILSLMLFVRFFRVNNRVPTVESKSSALGICSIVIVALVVVHEYCEQK